MSETVSIKEHTVMKRTIAYCEEKINEETFTQIILIGESKAVNKCISIAEILKRSHPNLKQTSILDESPERSDEPRLTITLSKH
ncbi:ribonuclease P [Tritrichomonas musculus]|uniref:Ribonuclease P n=1 Tax=Tritrichomonas musculus TaxID=1915356 RepID=A0ABR2KLF7_9EUKA